MAIIGLGPTPPAGGTSCYRNGGKATPHTWETRPPLFIHRFLIHVLVVPLSRWDKKGCIREDFILNSNQNVREDFILNSNQNGREDLLFNTSISLNTTFNRRFWKPLLGNAMSF
ncbi:hypothetical protein AVEN_216726-1 [Araneus ventricosus]|uniref:Uncharacterized protein n=1 Tax=Araneus ventricosus TaxID=182803 RepID=A0A4Y2SY09_ARAVE|nr:hypothetical protein AVEN_216726-1 [Araneus ventricosus]